MEETQTQTETIPAKKRDSKTLEMVLLLVLGILVGFSAKTEAAKRITMGSDDYLLSQQVSGIYDLNAVQRDVIAKGDAGTIAGPQAAGGSCGGQ